MADNAAHLAAVSDRIAGAIKAFYTLNPQAEFHADDLRNFVSKHTGRSAPNSAYRVMYDLRKRGLLAYTVVSRSKSLYRFSPLPN